MLPVNWEQEWMLCRGLKGGEGSYRSAPSRAVLSAHSAGSVLPVFAAPSGRTAGGWSTPAQSGCSINTAVSGTRVTWQKSAKGGPHPWPLINSSTSPGEALQAHLTDENTEAGEMDHLGVSCAGLALLSPVPASRPHVPTQKQPEL